MSRCSLLHYHSTPTTPRAPILASTTMAQIEAEWADWTRKYPDASRWVDSNVNEDLADNPPVRQLEWKKKKPRCKIAFEDRSQQWVIYKLWGTDDEAFQGKHIESRVLVVCSSAIPKVFKVWKKDRKALPAAVAKEFMSMYEGVSIDDALWMIDQFKLLNSAEIDVMWKKVQYSPCYLSPEDFVMVDDLIEATFLAKEKKRPAAIKKNIKAKDTETIVREKVQSTAPCISQTSKTDTKSKDAKESGDIDLQIAEASGDAGLKVAKASENVKLNVAKAADDIGLQIASASDDAGLKVAKTPDDADFKVTKHSNDIGLQIAEASGDTGLNAASPEGQTEVKVTKASANIASTTKSNSVARKGTEVKAVKRAAEELEYDDEVSSAGEVDGYGYSLRDDDDEDEEEEETYADPKLPAKKERFPPLSIPKGAKQGRVEEKDWPTGFNVVIDRVGCYTIKNQDGKLKEIFFVLKSGYDWIEYNPNLKDEPEAKRQRLQGTGQRFHPNTSREEIRRATRITGMINARWGHTS
ncbi:hypothetical protein VTL71DRAFT_8128 [Oculimacula yallundae]|uniref:Uncharacterized protein n=1 Tax=Oculimacula yallundae TaxID=86028 RepID=A0ABR4CWS2_9HELO